jgi:capsular exopolysaccharide synthesis family protein
MTYNPRATPLPDQFHPGAQVPLNGHGPVAAAHVDGGQTPTLGALLVALKRRSFLAVVLATAAAALTVIAVAVVFPPKYVAQARLELNSSPNRTVIVAAAAEPDTDPAIYRANQLAIIKSPLVISRALNSEKLKGLKIAGGTPESLEPSIKVDFLLGPGIMSIKLFGDEPTILADVLNAIVAAYIKEVDDRDNRRRKDYTNQLDKSFTDLQVLLSKKRVELQAQEKEEKIPDEKLFQMRSQELTSKLYATDQQLQAIRIDIGQKKHELKGKTMRLEKVGEEPVSAVRLKQILSAERQIVNLWNRVSIIDEQIAQLSAVQGNSSGNSRVGGLIESKTSLEGLIKKTEADLKPLIEKLLREEVKEDVEKEVRLLQGSIERLEIQEKEVALTREKDKAAVNTLNLQNFQGGVAVQKMRDEVKQIEATLSRLSLDINLIKSEPNASSKIVVLQAAETPTDMDYSRLLKFGTAGGLGIFGLVLLGVAFVEYRSGKVTGVDEITKGLGLTLVGTMPKVPGRARRGTPAMNAQKNAYWQSLITESIDAIRTQLVHSSKSQDLHIVMVTSAGGGEGKTSLASQLAASLARAWKKTLLVDGDLRNPAAHKLFNLALEPGFSEILRGEATIADAVKPTLLSRLWLMPAGNWDAHAVQALAQDGVKTMFAQLKDQYEFIVVDSCPVLPVADSLVLGQHVDAVIFSVLRDVSRVGSVNAAQQKMAALGIRTLGAVVIGAEGDPGSVAYKYVAQVGS